MVNYPFLAIVAVSHGECDKCHETHDIFLVQEMIEHLFGFEEEGRDGSFFHACPNCLLCAQMELEEDKEEFRSLIGDDEPS